MENKYNFTFIIPHKNIPEMLKRCVFSIPRRDDVQIIIVDDNSDPGIVDFRHFPFLEDTHVEIFFDKTGKGAGHARNVGLKHATGKWLVFADSDDFFLYSINDALNDHVDDEADIVFFNYNNIDNNSYRPTKHERSALNIGVDQYFSGSEDALRYGVCVPWGKFVKRKLVQDNDIRFQETKKNNDDRFAYLTGYYAKKINAERKAIYCLTERGDSITRDISDDTLLDSVIVSADAVAFFNTHSLNSKWKSNELGAKLLYLKTKRPHLYEKALKLVIDRGITQKEITKRIRINQMKGIVPSWAISLIKCILR